MSFFGNSGFGAQSSSPFGQTQQTSVFGQTPQQQPQQQSAFGAPAFGAASAPAFGAQSASAFGSSAFGASTGGGFGFGASPAPSNPFGAAASTPAFGAASTATPFGATPGASSSPFGGGSSLFGQTQPAFGAAPATPGFGSPAGGGLFGQQSAPAFGSTVAPFGGAAPGAFGSSGFGQPAARGTRSVPWQKTQDTEQTSSGVKLNYNSISCMPQYIHKSHEELRWEDYQDGNKGGGGVASPAAGGGLFGAAAATPAPQTAFGAASGAAFGGAAPFGGAGGGAFGASQPSAFGAAATPSLFGGGAATSAFGATPQSQPAFGGSAFGAAASAPAFGASPASQPSAFGGFGTPASQPSAFGGFGTPASQPSAFGASPASQPSAFGGFGAPASQPSAFGMGATGGSLFGATSAPAFGGFGAASTPAAGATSAFGAATSAPAFGGGGLFGATSSAAPAFGAASSAPAGGGLFGGGLGAASTPATGGFSFSLGGAAGSAPGASAPAPAPSLFGAAASTPTTGSLFGAPAAGASTPAFGGGAFSFGGAAGSSSALAAPAAAGSSLFGGFGAGTPAAGTPGGAPAFSFAGAAAPAPGSAQGAPAPGGAAPGPSSPYGALPALPAALPASPGVGLSHQRRASPWAAGGSLGTPPPRVPALALPRTLSPRPGSRLRPARAVSLLGGRGRSGSVGGASADGASAGSPAGSGIFAVAAATPPSDVAAKDRGTGSPAKPATVGSPGVGVFTPREDPRRLFIRDALPSTAAASSSTPSRLGGPAPGAPSPLAALPATPGAFAAAARPLDGAAPAIGPPARSPTPPRTNGAHASPVNEAKAPHAPGGAAQPPTLTRAEYYTTPSASELASLAREDPGALAALPEFVVGRRGLGSVRWLEPVDVRGLDLDSIVSISRGSVEVYLEGPDKPAVGTGLNRPAEVTMLRVHKMDRATGQPTADPAALDAFARKLRRVSAEQGARFVSYDAKTGTWRFQVEHFSRYGLVDSDEEEDDDYEYEDEYEEEGVLETRLAGGSSNAARGRRLGLGLGSDSDDVSVDDAARPMTDDDDDGGGGGGSSALSDNAFFDAERRALVFAEGSRRRAAASNDASSGSFFSQAPVLATLASSAGMGASELSDELVRVREGLFGSKRAPSPADAGRAHASPRFAPPQAKTRRAEAPRAGRASLERRPATTNWVKRPAALLPPRAGKGFADAGESLALVPAKPQVVTQTNTEPASLADWPRAFGGAFGAKWASGMALASRLGADRVSLTRLASAAAGETSDATLLLRLHLNHSRVQRADERAWPRWRLRCRRESQLAPLTAEYVTTYGSLASAASSAGVRQACAQLAAAWDLVRILFEGREGERALRDKGDERHGLRRLSSSEADDVDIKNDEEEVSEGGLEAASSRSSDDIIEIVDDDEDDAMVEDSSRATSSAVSEEGTRSLGASTVSVDDDDDDDLDTDEGEQQLLVDFWRRAELSAWLRDRARASTCRALGALRERGGLACDPSAPARVAALAPSAALVLLTGRQVAAAAAVASGAGDVRLATLIAQAGASWPALPADAAAQLAAWRAAGIDRYVDGARECVLELLAGNAERVAPLVGDDWRRALGLFVWYGLAPDAPLHEPLERYRLAVERGEAAAPVPLHARGQLSDDEAAQAKNVRVAPATAAPATDGAWELLQLGVTWRNGGCGPVRGALVGELLRRLGRPGSWTDDPLDAAPGWHLLTALAGAGVLREDDDDDDEDETCAVAVERSADLLIGRLEAAGLPAWALYVALCLPRRGPREAAAQALLERHAGAWEDPATRRFLEDTLQVPRQRIAAARAGLARAQGRTKDCLAHLLEAGSWQSAHDTLCADLAAPWFLDDGEEAEARLRGGLEALRPHAGAIVGYAQGAGLYESHLALRRAFLRVLPSTRRGARPAGDAAPDPALESFRGRFAACEEHARALGLAQARWGGRGTDPGQGRGADRALARRQEALARMGAELAAWVLSDSEEGREEAPPSAQQTLLAAAVPAQPQLHAAWSVRLAAVALTRELEGQRG